MKEPIAWGALVRTVFIVLGSIGVTQFTEGEQDTIVAGITAAIVAIDLIIAKFTRDVVTPVDKAAKNAAKVVRETTGDPNAAAEVARTIRTGELPPSVKR